MSAREFAPEELDAAQAALERSRPAPVAAARPEDILADVARRHHMTAATLLGPSRARGVAAARKEAYRALRATGMSYPEIGRVMHRDHTSVMHGCKGAA